MTKQLSEHFSEDEFRCHCPCGQVHVDPELPPALEKLRGLVAARLGRDTPLVVLSGYRCPGYNREVGGVGDSQHLRGAAADTKVPDGMTVAQLAALANQVRAFREGGIGEYPGKGFVHCDVRQGMARWRG
jgi:uncharacterized protein YcbK (DUF882 family)